DMVLVVTEPTISGQHDLERVIELTEHFGIPTAVCINKHDINSEIAKAIEERTAERGLKVAGKIAYDTVVTEAQIAARSVVEYSNNSVKQQIVSLWKAILNMLNTEEIK
ncbi:unnamed protein product, partial [marine sediment metagenome]